MVNGSTDLQLIIYYYVVIHTKEGNVLFNDAPNTFLFTVIWRRTYGKVPFRWRERKPMDYSFRLAARVIVCTPSHRQDSTYHGLCYTSRGVLAGTRNNSMGPPCGIDPTTHRTMSKRSYHEATFPFIIQMRFLLHTH